MSQSMATKGKIAADPHSAEAFATDWASDRAVFKGVPWGKAMMWIFLLSDTFIFSSFLVSYMTVRSSTTLPPPHASAALALPTAAPPLPLTLLAPHPQRPRPTPRPPPP